MTVPSKWTGNEAQRLNAQTLNPISQGYIWPRHSAAPTGSLSLSYYDLTKNKPGFWNDSEWIYWLEEDASGNVTVTGTLNVDGAATFDTTLGVTGATTLSGTLAAGNTTITGTLSTTAAATLNSLGVTNNATVGGTLGVTGTATMAAINGSGNILTTGNVGYRTGAGGAVTQTGSRTTAVTLNKICGSITLVSAAGSASWQTFTVNCTPMDVADSVIVSQKSGTDKYLTHVTAVTASSFDITFATTGGTTTEQPVFNFAVIKGSTS